MKEMCHRSIVLLFSMFFSIDWCCSLLSVALFAWGCQDCCGCDGVTSVWPTGRVALSSSSTSLVLPGRSDD